MIRAYLGLTPAARLFVGARFVCTKCKTRGVSPRCACGAKTAAVDLADPAHADFLKELTSKPPSPGAPSREELFWDGLKSRPQWLLSALLAIAVGVVVAVGETSWTWPKLGYLLAEVALLTLLFRLPMLAAELLFRLFVVVLALLVAAGCFIAGGLTRSRRLGAAASNWLARAERILNGEYLWRRSMVELRAPPALYELTYRGALLPSTDLCLLVSKGAHGALALSDAEAPPFRVMLESGETIVVSVELGTISVESVAVGASDARPRSPLFLDTEAWRVPSRRPITLQGGEWVESEQGAGYRAPLEPRTLRGTVERPLEVSIGAAPQDHGDEAPALTPGRPPRSSP